MLEQNSHTLEYVIYTTLLFFAIILFFGTLYNMIGVGTYGLAEELFGTNSKHNISYGLMFNSYHIIVLFVSTIAVIVTPIFIYKTYIGKFNTF